MIYTSYYSNWRNFPNRALIVQVSVSAPIRVNDSIEWAIPSWKNMVFPIKNQEITEEEYKRRYLEQLNSHEEIILKDMKKLERWSMGGRDVMLCCFEKPPKFCHRSILREWLNQRGYNIAEFPYK